MHEGILNDEYNGADNQQAVYCSVYSELKRKSPSLFPSGSSALLCPGSMLKFCLCGFNWNNSLLDIRPYFTLHYPQIIFSL